MIKLGFKPIFYQRDPNPMAIYYHPNVENNLREMRNKELLDMSQKLPGPVSDSPIDRRQLDMLPSA